MSSQPAASKSRTQTLLLAAIAALLAVDVGARVSARGEAVQHQSRSTVIPVSYQPQDVQMANSLEQRQRMIAELKSIDRRLGSIESRLSRQLRVEVTNFPKPAPEKE
ncbi:MAG: hypothetical protein COB69_05080 [Phycisphaera sp.]|nr:MAG: hypothetical protein COB69_05080 [Phycisphaera sp.]